MKLWIHKLFSKRLWKKYEKDFWLILDVTITSVCVALMLRLLPFRIIARWLGSQDVKENKVLIPKLSTDKFVDAMQIGHYSELINRKFAWRNVCLVSGITAKFILGRRGIKNSILFFGVKKQSSVTKEEKYSLQAHAWLKLNNQVITGDSELHLYKQLVGFQKVDNYTP